MQILESPFPPLTAAALRMLICKRLVPPEHHLQEAPPDDHFVLSVKESISMKKRSKFSHLLTVMAEWADPPHKISVFFTTPLRKPQGGRSCAGARGATAQKFGHENSKPEHTLFCRKLRFAAIYVLFFGDLWAKKSAFLGKNSASWARSALLHGIYCIFH